jgi:hypothetical protein
MFDLILAVVGWAALAIFVIHPMMINSVPLLVHPLMWVWNPRITLQHTTTKDAWRMILAEGFRPPRNEERLNAPNRFVYFQAKEDLVSFGAWNQKAYYAMVRAAAELTCGGSFVLETRRVRVSYRMVRRLGRTEAQMCTSASVQSFGRGVEVVVPRSLVNEELLHRMELVGVPEEHPCPLWLRVAGYAGAIRHAQRIVGEEVRLYFSR